FWILGRLPLRTAYRPRQNTMKNASSLFTDKFIREHTPTLDDLTFTRREFLERTGMGFGAMSLASILGMGLGGNAVADTGAAKVAGPLAPKAAPLPAKAKAVIHIFA